MRSDLSADGALATSLSAAELAEKLEKSEAGRKKLRQAISLMQEKLQETESILKLNESLTLECEKERERVEEEKKKAEEEKRLRLLLEKDSANVKDQLAKVLQRLGAVETKQKSDKKEVECLRKEVRSAVQGVSAAAEAIKTMQCSFQTLEHSIFVKINAAFDKANVASEEAKNAQKLARNLENEFTKKTNMVFEEAGIAMQTVKSLQQSLHDLENREIIRPDEKLTTAEAEHISEKLLCGITQLFNKEKKTHQKIEHQLAALKTMLRSSRRDSESPGMISSLEKSKCKESRRNEKHEEPIKKGNRSELKGKHEKHHASKKRKLTREDEPCNWLPNKKEKLQQTDVSLQKVGLEGSNKQNKESMMIPQSIEYDKSVEHAGLSSCKRFEHGGSHEVCIGVTLPGHMHSFSEKKSSQSLNFEDQRIFRERHVKFSAKQLDGLTRNTEESLQATMHKSLVCGKEIENIINTDCLHEGENFCLECSDDDVDDDWWPGDTTPISPTLPDIHFPEDNIQSLSTREFMLKGNNVAISGADLHPESVRNEACFLSADKLDGNFPVHTLNRPVICLSEVGETVEITSHSMVECKLIADTTAVSVNNNNNYLDNVNNDGSTGINKSGPNFECAGSVSICTDSEMQNAQVGLSNGVLYFATETKSPEAIQNGQSLKSDFIINPENIVSHACSDNVIGSMMISTDIRTTGTESQPSSNASSFVFGHASHHVENQMIRTIDVSSKATCLQDSAAGTESEAQELAIGSIESLQNSSILVVSSPSKDRMLEEDGGRFVRHVGASNEMVSVSDSPMEHLQAVSCSVGEENKESNTNDLEFEVMDVNIIDQMNNLVEILPSILPTDTCILSKVHTSNDLVETDTQIIFPVEIEKNDLYVNENIPCSAQILETTRDMSGMVEKKAISQTEITELYREKISTQESTPWMQSNDSYSHFSCKICLIQTFDFDISEVKTKVIEVCLNTLELRRYFSRAYYTDSAVELSQKALHLRSDCAEIPIQLMACCLISIAVSLVKQFNEDVYSEAKTNISFISVFVAFIRTVYTDMANLLFESFFAQLGSFLYESKVMVLSLRESESSPVDVPGTVNCTHCISFEYSKATLEDINAGSKVLAGLCQVLSCVTHLQNVVYELLGSYDKDTMWLLTVFSSFASICGRTAFIVDADDILGRAISAIIIELVINFQEEVSKHEETSLSASSNLSKGLAVLIDILDPTLKLTVADVFTAAVAALQRVLGSCKSLIANCTMQMIPSSEVRNPDNVLQSSHLNEAVEVSKICRNEDTDTDIHAWQCESDLEKLKSWQRKYSQSVGTLELISVFMGWEWTYNHLIIRCLWRTIASGSGRIEAAGIMHVISVLSRNGLSSSGEEFPGIRELRTRFTNSYGFKSLATPPCFSCE